jgi:hypothetical protein
MSTITQTPLADVGLAFTAANRIHVRLAARRNAVDTWLVQSLIIDILPDVWLDNRDGFLNDWPQPSFYYRFGPFGFFAGMVSSGEALEWFTRPGEHTIENVDHRLGSGPTALRFQLPEFYENASTARYPNHHDDGYQIMPWPHTLYNFNIKTPSPAQSADMDFLVSNECPYFFPDLRSAVFALVYGISSLDRARAGVLQDTLAIRQVHSEGWLERIRVTPTRLSISVAGTQLVGSHVRVSGAPDVQADRPIEVPTEIQVALPNGLPPQLWVALTRDNLMLDYIILDPRWSPFARTPANTVVEPGDLPTRFQELIARGEGPTVEFKADVPEPKDKMLKTVSAFANGEGGVILLGVENGTGNLVGIKRDINRELDRLTDMIRANLTPAPPIRLAWCEIEHNTIIGIFVGQGDAHPCGLHPADPSYFVRRGATTFAARPEEVTNIVVARNAVSHSMYRDPFLGYQ